MRQHFGYSKADLVEYRLTIARSRRIRSPTAHRRRRAGAGLLCHEHTAPDEIIVMERFAR